MTYLGSPKLKEFVDNNVKCDGNGEKFSKRVQNSVGNGAIVLLVLQTCRIKGLFGKGLVCGREINFTTSNKTCQV